MLVIVLLFLACICGIAALLLFKSDDGKLDNWIGGVLGCAFTALAGLCTLAGCLAWLIEHITWK